MREFILKYWVQWGMALFASCLAAMGKHFQSKQKQQQLRTEAVERGVRAMLRSEITNTYYRAQDRDYTTTYEHDNMEELYRSYEALGGNGTGHKLYEDYQDIEIRNTLK